MIPPEVKQQGETLLYLEGVSVSFDGFKALNKLALDVKRGELRAIIGPNGAGKSTMMDVITGKTKPDEGRVMFGNIDLTKHDEAAIANLGIGRKFQKPTVFDKHSVWQNLELSLKADRSPFAALSWKASPLDNGKIEEMLELINLSSQRGDLAANLSHGQKQWLEIGMLLMQEPELLLVDEPVAGMTDAETEKTAHLLKRIAGDKSVVVVEHDMDFIDALNVRVTVLHEGSVLAEGDLDAVKNNARVVEVYLGR
jgi:urea transport system ATP-binding protein